MNLTTSLNSVPGQRAAPPADEDGALEDQLWIPGELEHAEGRAEHLDPRPRVERSVEGAEDVLVDGAAAVVGEFLGDHTHVTSAKFSDFWTPCTPCPHLLLIYCMKCT